MVDDNILLFTDLSRHKAEAIIKQLAADTSKVFFSNHVLVRMKQHKISTEQVFKCLQHGVIIEGAYKTPNGNFEAKLSTVTAGIVLNVVVALDYDDATGNYIIVVTTF